MRNNTGEGEIKLKANSCPAQRATLPGRLPQRLCEGSAQLPLGSTFTPLAGCLSLGWLPLFSPKVATRTSQTLKTAENAAAIAMSRGKWGQDTQTRVPAWGRRSKSNQPSYCMAGPSSFLPISVCTLPMGLFYLSVPSVPYHLTLLSF